MQRFARRRTYLGKLRKAFKREGEGEAQSAISQVFCYVRITDNMDALTLFGDCDNFSVE